MSDQTLAQLRRALRQRRRTLTPAWRRQASAALARHFQTSALFWRSRHLALFCAFDGEPDLAPVLERADAAGKRCYLPALRRDRHLFFLRYRPDDPLRPNRLGIPEPLFRYRRLMPAWALELVLLPLLAFDGRGNRLGMGAGYYDRSLAFCRDEGAARPFLLGVAWNCQELDALQARPWDVPLDGVLTETGVRLFKDQRRM